MPKEETVVKKEKQKPEFGEDFDVVIIGAGPAGMSAALCSCRAKLKVLILDSALPGGEASTAYKVWNYIGFPDGILGENLAKKMEDHLNNYDISYSCEKVEDIINISSSIKTIKTDLENEYNCKAVIVCSGLEPKEIDKPFEKQFLGRGISYYAQCDGEYYQGKTVAVFGSGNCASYASDYLAEFVEKLYLINPKDYLKAVSSLKEKVMNNSVIDIIWDTEIDDVFGIDKVEKIKLLSNKTGQSTWLDVSCVFVYVGRQPSKDIISIEFEVDEAGFILTDEYMRTNIPGVYAAGDIRSKQIRQIATAVSDGMIAAVNVEKDIIRVRR
ncbi:thioredoxin-disulfide reductase [Candidatus Marinamargulisbacteria bacterium SCGC AG-410-N11]|nr:thioredoxin-disulfide reductase [Candidatus Marinamargulisbacteria bacterium SCGC AG-410-N11]